MKSAEWLFHDSMVQSKHLGFKTQQVIEGSLVSPPLRPAVDRSGSAARAILVLASLASGMMWQGGSGGVLIGAIHGKMMINKGDLVCIPDDLTIFQQYIASLMRDLSYSLFRQPRCNVGNMGGTAPEDGRPMDVHEARTSMWCSFSSAVFSGDVFMFAGLSRIFLSPPAEVSRFLDFTAVTFLPCALPDLNHELQISMALLDFSRWMPDRMPE